ncbi:MAG: putative Ig domain-containing protein [Thermoplasmatota archaeon]
MKLRGAVPVIIVLSASLISLLHVIEVHSSPEWEMDMDLSAANTRFTTDGPADDELGTVVRIIGDVNGDGYDDIAMGAPNNDSGGMNSGHVYIFFGSGNGLPADVNVKDADASFVGEGMTDFLGDVIEGAGDINADGYDDILIGCDMTAGGKGRVHLIMGNNTGWTMNRSISQSNAIFEGTDSTETIGGAVCGKIDLNYDGFDDIVFSSKVSNINGTNSGHTYIFFGKNTGFSGIISASNADASLIGDVYDNSGWSLANAGDINGDNYDDLMVGAFSNRAGYINKVYLVFGRWKPLWGSQMSLSMSNASFERESPNDNVGVTISGAGDVNGDGFSDMLMGADTNDEHGNNRGQVYLILGRSAPWTMKTSLSTSNASFYGEADNDHLGSSVSGGGDVNGDGYSDILIGAEGNGENGQDAGQTYLVFGSSTGWSMDTTISAANASYFGHEGSYSGDSVSINGDVNCDGYDDILIGGAESNNGTVWLVLEEINDGPLPIVSFKVYADNEYSKETRYGSAYSTYYIEIVGTDQNSTRKDKVPLLIGGDVVPVRRIELTETFSNSGIFRGSIFRFSDILPGEPLFFGSRIDLSCVHDPSFFWEILISSPEFEFTSRPNPVMEDEELVWEFEYRNITIPIISMTTSADFLSLDLENNTITGKPDNSDVGDYEVEIRIGSEWNTNFHTTIPVLNVTNVPPKILTNDTVNVSEDQYYLVDYNSDDDGQGLITWHLETNASWLAVNVATGWLSGTPSDEDVGEHWVNVSVDDGNGGWDWSNFTLTVNNVNDDPGILIPVNTIAMEDLPFELLMDARDPDPVSVLYWTMTTDSSWLSINESSGLITGTATNDDVGVSRVNISVTDEYGGSDSIEFNITVLNANDPPVITTSDKYNATEGALYSNRYSASDIDPTNDTLTWHLDTNASGWLTIDGNTGLLSGTPGYDQSGTYWINVSVNDGKGGKDSHYFMLEVTDAEEPPPNTPPVLTLGGMDPSTGDTSTTFAFSVHYTDHDESGTPNVTVVIDRIPHRMFLQSGEVFEGIYVYSTTLGLGEHTYYFTADDGELKAVSGDGTPIKEEDALKTPNIKTPEISDDDEDDDDSADDDAIPDDDDQNIEGAPLWIVLITVVALVLILAAGIYFWLGSRKKETISEE